MRSNKTLGKGTDLKPFAIYSKTDLIKFKNKLIFSPVWGIVDYIKQNQTNTEIGIYLRGYNDIFYDPHSVYAPITGIINNISFAPSDFIRKFKHRILINSSIRSSKSIIVDKPYNKEIKYKDNITLYKSHEKKNGKLNINMKNITFTLEVGNKYIAKSIALYNYKSDYVYTGQQIGDILIGSYCIIKIKKKCKLHINVGQNIIGGVCTNPIATLL